MDVEDVWVIVLAGRWLLVGEASGESETWRLKMWVCRAVPGAAHGVMEDTRRRVDVGR